MLFIISLSNILITYGCFNILIYCTIKYIINYNLLSLTVIYALRKISFILMNIYDIKNLT